MATILDNKSNARSRGRPRGSGIDDAGELAAVRTLLAANPRLKPTTAIKQLGISNPSIVRRLRNKLAVGETVLANGAAAAPASAPETPRAVTRAVKPPVLAPVAPSVTALAAATEAAGPEETPRQAQERALLAAYLEALSREAPAAPLPIPNPATSAGTSARETDVPMPSPGARGATAEAPKPADQNSRDQNSGPTPQIPFAGLFPPMSANPFAGVFPGMPSMPMPGFAGMGFPGMTMPGHGQGMSFPGFPAFMQPLQQKAAPPTPGTDAYRQLEAFKLAIEAMTSIAKFQLHLAQNANAYSPMSLMLQGQAFMGQMLMASLTGQMDAMGRKK